ncbi:M15 family metallopeptidase [Paenibacillus marinisediminis]
MKLRRLTAICLMLSLGAALVLSGCGTDKPAEGQGTTQTSEVDPAMTPQDGKSDQESKDQESKDPESKDKENKSEETSAIAEIQSEYALSKTIEEQGGKQVVTNPNSIYVVVNKERFLPEGYEPPDLVEPQVKFSFEEPHEKRHMRKEAADALEQLFAQAKEDGIELNAVSGYRSEKRQTSLYSHYVETQGEEYANRVSAKPGTSEHQTGLTIDVSSPSVNNELEQVFGDSEEGKWLAEHAHDSGFIIRYPKDGEEITGYMYEPWHIRYVGVDAATAIYEQGITLEQFLSSSN